MKKIGKKLKLAKVTVADLEREAQRLVNGGAMLSTEPAGCPTSKGLVHPMCGG
jgi:hypothetical protein